MHIGLKWPLAKATILGGDFKLGKEFEDIIKSQLNVKRLEFRENHAKQNDVSVDLDTKVTPELEAEGYVREMSRKVQAFRKQLGLQKKDKVETCIIVDEEFKKILEKQKKFIKDRTNSKKLEIVTTGKERFKNKTDFKIKDKRGWVGVKITTGR